MALIDILDTVATNLKFEEKKKAVSVKHNRIRYACTMQKTIFYRK